MSTAEIQESFDSQISIYDLSSFLGCLSLFDQPQFDTSNSQYLAVSDSGGRSKTRFFYADPDVIVQPPIKNCRCLLRMYILLLKQEHFSHFNAAAVYQVPDLCLYGENGMLKLCVTDKKNETSNTFSMEVGECKDDFCYCFKIENLKLLLCDYKVTVSKHKRSILLKEKTYVTGLH